MPTQISHSPEDELKENAHDAVSKNIRSIQNICSVQIVRDAEMVLINYDTLRASLKTILTPDKAEATLAFMDGFIMEPVEKMKRRLKGLPRTFSNLQQSIDTAVSTGK